MVGHHWPAGQHRNLKLNTHDTDPHFAPLEKGAFFVGLDQAIQDLNIVLSSPTSRVSLLDRDGDAAKPVFSRPCSCHVGASSAMASRLVAVLGGRTRR